MSKSSNKNRNRHRRHRTSTSSTTNSLSLQRQRRYQDSLSTTTAYEAPWRRKRQMSIDNHWRSLRAASHKKIPIKTTPASPNSFMDNKTLIKHINNADAIVGVLSYTQYKSLLKLLSVKQRLSLLLFTDNTFSKLWPPCKTRCLETHEYEKCIEEELCKHQYGYSNMDAVALDSESGPLSKLNFMVFLKAVPAPEHITSWPDMHDRYCAYAVWLCNVKQILESKEVANVFVLEHMRRKSKVYFKQKL